ncbi:glycosyltransferase family 4 protein [Oceanimonas sp. MB9]|uniref:glycosyltransferase family 4 protein n=1 Tax=Oceanimonas sp. MB9 TaxID=2588453 RepID=UPI00197EEAA3|nr:glycosyltransferase family 4 protein [Oceanimonas sp. MB9]NHI01400.1 N,N'-diacetylbacillosaminyl-diphospho-undecaprenol alpha-1,3-N-acetylgalactosaminyltransferase [Oceanimonas sp. MB9]
MLACNKEILFVVNVPEFFISHRLPLAVAAQAEGYKVHVASAAGKCVDEILSLGFKHHVIPFVRSGQNPLVELITVVKLISLMRRIQPDLVHLITIKPVLYGGIAARVAGVKSVVAAVSGLGTVFLASSRFGRLRKWLVTRLYGAAFKQQQLAVIFQNPDDRDTLLQADVLSTEQIRMIRGSGVALEKYPLCKEPEGRPVVVMAARLLRDKGVAEFVEAAQLLTQRELDVEMRLIGSPDPGNPTTVTPEELARWAEEGCVNLLGFREDIATQYAAANIVCLPSYYGEGLPKCLVEAAACGRAVVTTDHPGCRDAIIPNVTGLLVPIKDSVALADAIQRFVEDAQLRHRMGEAGRTLAEEVFAIEKIVSQHMEIYNELVSS